MPVRSRPVKVGLLPVPSPILVRAVAPDSPTNLLPLPIINILSVGVIALRSESDLFLR